MAFMDVKFYSEALGMQAEVYVVLPQKRTKGQIGMDSKAKEGKYKCLYLLHGLSDDHTIWMRRTSIERYASDYGICVVMPCGHRSFYTDMKYGGKYFTYVAKELPAKMREFFNISDKREDNFVAGLSMGGYGAMKVGLRECDNFCAIGSLSAVMDIKLRDFDEVLVPVFGTQMEIPDEDDLFYLVNKQKDNPNRPRIFVGVGTQDGLLEGNHRMRDELEKLGYDMVYRESEGNHNWAFWDEYIQYVLKWMFEEK